MISSILALVELQIFFTNLLLNINFVLAFPRILIHFLNIRLLFKNRQLKPWTEVLVDITPYNVVFLKSRNVVHVKRLKRL